MIKVAVIIAAEGSALCDRNVDGRFTTAGCDFQFDAPGDYVQVRYTD